MKLFLLQILLFAKNKKAKKNVLLLARFVLFLALIITLYSVSFHLLMVYEGRDYSWITGFYWTLTVMSTLGFGDITFHTDFGLLFTLLVLISGVVLLLIMLPFAFIQFFWAPWLEAQNELRTPRALPETTENHVILTTFDSLTRNLVERLKKHLFDYYFVCSDHQTASEIQDGGYNIVLGEIDAPETYEKMQVDKAALVVTTADDLLNTNISFTVREISSSVPIACSVDNEHSLDILHFPGNTHVFQFMKMLGINMAEQTMPFTTTNIIGRFEELHVGEFPVRDTDLTGQTLAEARLRNNLGITVIGLLEKGEILPPAPDIKLMSTNILILAGTLEELTRAGELLTKPEPVPLPDPRVLVLGGGRVGTAAAKFLDSNDITYMVVEKQSETEAVNRNLIHGDAADINTLKKAGIDNARSVLITTHSDAMNIYLSFYCRQLRPDIQIVSRATKEHTIPKLHRAGADLVDSSASMGATSIMNILHPSNVSFFSDALQVFGVATPETFVGKTMTELKIREKTQCSVLAMKSDGRFITNPDPTQPLTKTDELILAGSLAAEELFKKEYFD
ncbi:MAG TPA: potassium channel protein [Desulfocapsa sulfexigens]|nr:potassium channel protein [Desulfocapsa sulfexigens]